MQIIFAWVNQIIDFESREEYLNYIIKLDEDRVSYFIDKTYDSVDSLGNRVFTVELRLKYKDFNTGGF